jgi:hypothetical protein
LIGTLPGSVISLLVLILLSVNRSAPNSWIQWSAFPSPIHWG